MTTTHSTAARVLAVGVALALTAAACGSDDDTADTTPDSGAVATDASEPADDVSTGTEQADDTEPTEPSDDDGGGEPPTEADSSLDPVMIGLIAQDEELVSFPEVRAVAQAFTDYFNAELGGIGGHPVELDVCGAGDTPESALSCAQEFANNDDVQVVLQGNVHTAATNEILVNAGKPVMTQGNDVPDYVTPGVYLFEPGLFGMSQLINVFAAEDLGASTATLFVADDPLFDAIVPFLTALAGAAGIEFNETIRLGFEPDLTGPISAADTSNDAWFVVVGDPSQCAATAQGATNVGYEGAIIANDVCLTPNVVESGDIDGWYGPTISITQAADGGAEVDEIVRILDTYGSEDAQRGGLAGWTVANMLVSRDVLVTAGGVDATSDTVTSALASYSSTEILGFPDVACPGPGVFVSLCNPSPIILQVRDGELFQATDFVEIDFSIFEAIL